MKKFLKRLKADDGFTLIEMLTVIMVISILMLMVISNVGGVKDSVANKTNQGIVQTVESEMLIYDMDKGGKVTAEELESEGIITKEQLDIYKASKKTINP